MASGNWRRRRREPESTVPRWVGVAGPVVAGVVLGLVLTALAFRLSIPPWLGAHLRRWMGVMIE